MIRLITLITISLTAFSAGMLSAQELERFVRYSQNGCVCVLQNCVKITSRQGELRLELAL